MSRGGWEHRPKKWDWRGGLTLEEAERIELLEGAAARLDEARRSCTAELNVIRNRALQRVKARAIAAGDHIPQSRVAAE